VVNWILAGHSDHDIAEAFATYFPDVAPGPILAAAADYFDKAGQPNPIAIRGFCIEACRDAIRKANTIGDLTTVLKAVKLLKDLVKDV
jgi:hypothetical protein